MHVRDLLILRTMRLIGKEANYEGKEDALRLGTPNWVGAPHQPRTLHLWKCPDPFVPGRPHLGRWFFNIMYFYGFVFLVKFPTAAGLIKTE